MDAYNVGGISTCRLLAEMRDNGVAGDEYTQTTLEAIRTNDRKLFSRLPFTNNGRQMISDIGESEAQTCSIPGIATMRF
uniref:CAZy families GH103 protein n=1 Tax=Steinernema glaseri TaxID=37863 RepID=A0A1I7Y6S8_9BILA